MPTLILDIETVGENYDDLDEITQAALTGWVERRIADPKERQKNIKQIKEELALSPLTGKIVALGVLDYEKEKGTVYFSASTADSPEWRGPSSPIIEGNYTFKPMSEADMLASFWQGAANYDTFVTYNGRSFDIPYLMVRSAVHGVKPTKNLMSNRYLGSQWSGARHIDLKDQLNFYGAVDTRRHGSLHLWTRAFGIESPKGGMSGYEVSKYFAEGKILDIARYNSRDLTATASLYQRWQTYFNP